jgi:hypothetical protein
MLFAEQTEFRLKLHQSILQAVKEYEQQTGWKVKGIDYTPGIPELATRVTEGNSVEIDSTTSPRSRTRAARLSAGPDTQECTSEAAAPILRRS